MTPEQFIEHMRLCDHRARCYVQGSAHHDKLKSIQPLAGGWSVHFAKHPRVIEAEREGWANELRSALVAECKRRMVAGEDVSDIDALMPNRARWWVGVRARAKKYREAEAYRDERLERTTNGALSDLSQRITGEASSGG